MSGKPKLLILSASLLIERILLFTNFTDELEKDFEITIWATSYKDEGLRELWDRKFKNVQQFPEFKPLKYFPHSILRRINERAWDLRYKPACRISFYEIRRKYQIPAHLKLLYNFFGGIISGLHMEEKFENWLNNKLFLTYKRSAETEDRLKTYTPDLVFSMGYYWTEDQAINPYFINKKIPVIAYTTSWDNVFTNSRFLFNYDAYIVWNDQMKKHVDWFFPQSRNVKVYAPGAPQFDILYREDFRTTREQFCEENGLDPRLPIVMYATGSPNMWDESETIMYLAKKVSEGYFGEVNYLVRPHPMFDAKNLLKRFEKYPGRLVIQKTSDPSGFGKNRNLNEEATRNWANTFYQVDVVVNMSSTSAIDAALLDKPVVNIDFDSSEGGKDERYIKDINHVWEHFKPVAESGGLWLVKDFDELALAVKSYLKDPSLHREKRRAMAEFIANNMDGKSGERLAATVKEIYGNIKKVNRK